MARFGLSEIQAKAILDMKLQRLTGLERDKIEAEYKELMVLIAELDAILESQERRMQHYQSRNSGSQRSVRRQTQDRNR